MTDMAPAIRAYLRSEGWSEGPPGQAGAIWTHPDGRRSVGVTHTVEYGNQEWQGILVRLPGRSGPEIEARIRHPELDPAGLPAQANLEYLATAWAALPDPGCLLEAGWRVVLDPAGAFSSKPAARCLAEAGEVMFWARTRDGREIETRRPAEAFTQRLRDRG